LVGNKLDEDILEVLSRDITNLHSINQIAKSLHKAYPYINKKIHDYLDEDILKKAVIGNAHLCFLNLTNDKTRLMLSLVEINIRNKHPRHKEWDELKISLNDIRSRHDIQTALVYKNSIIIVLENTLYAEEIKKSLNTNHNIIVIDKKNFQNEIVKNHDLIREKIILVSPERYYEIISEIQEKLIQIIQ
jgi:hypothetical protein